MNDAARVRVMLVDDHAVVRAGYRALLESDARFMVVYWPGSVSVPPIVVSIL